MFRILCMAGLYLGFSSDGTQSYQLPNSFNYVPVNIQITINDDDNPSMNHIMIVSFIII